MTRLCEVLLWSTHWHKNAHHINNSGFSFQQQHNATVTSEYWLNDCLLVDSVHVPLLIKMELRTESSCEDKSLHPCCFDYTQCRRPSGCVLPPFQWGGTGISHHVTERAPQLESKGRAGWLAAIQTASSSPTLMTDFKLLPDLNTWRAAHMATGGCWCVVDASSRCSGLQVLQATLTQNI